MAASFPGAVKNFSAIVNGVTKLVAALFNSPYDEITAIETELGTDPAGSAADVKTRLAVSLNADGTIKNAAVFTTALKTATGEVSGTTRVQATLPGGEYGFSIQSKNSSSSGDAIVCVAKPTTDGPAMSSTYGSYVELYAGVGTSYAQQRYVTASGEDLWVFLLIDKTTKEILGAYQAPDHPAYGNGGDFDKLPHPFGSYDSIKHEIVLVDNDTIAELKAQVMQEKSLLTLINEEYKPNMAKEEIYQPLHSGKFLDKKPELVQTIPDYIKVRKLEKLSQAEKDAKEVIHQQKTQEAQEKKAEEDLIQGKIKSIAIEQLKKEGKL